VIEQNRPPDDEGQKTPECWSSKAHDVPRNTAG
jgi:hypothetical protein